VLVDECGASSDPAIVAAGDCTRFRSRFSADAVRLESVQNATDQARAAGASVAGRNAPYTEVPWFWTVQHGCRVQIAGLFQGADEVVLRGRPDSRSFTCIYMKEGAPIAADSINRPAEHMAMRKLIARGEPVEPARLADEAVALGAA
jgi:3-phenylpropionate/trans-cinnamate dioxygenase ferredoxin reductase subunit